MPRKVNNDTKMIKEYQINEHTRTLNTRRHMEYRQRNKMTNLFPPINYTILSQHELISERIKKTNT